MKNFYFINEEGTLFHPDGHPLPPREAAAKLNQLVKDNARYRDRLQIDAGGSDKIDELQQAVQFLRHRVETAEAEVERWKSSYVEPCNKCGDETIEGVAEEKQDRRRIGLPWGKVAG